MQAFATQTVFEQTGGGLLMGRGKGLDGVYFVRSDFTSITLRIYDMAEPGVSINGTNNSGEGVPVSSVIFNSLQTSDPRWTVDSTGYNFRYTLKADDIPDGGRRYRFEFEMLPAGASDPFWGVFEVPTLSLYSV